MLDKKNLFETTFAEDPSTYELNFNIEANAKYITTPYANTTFDPIDYDKTILLYIKNNNNPNGLGNIIPSYVGGGGPSLYVGSTSGSIPTTSDMSLSGQPYTLYKSESF